MKKNKVGIIMLIGILVVLIIFLLFIMISGLRGKSFWGFNNFSMVSDELIIEKTYEKIFDEIVLDISAGEINIEKSSSDEVKVLVYGEENRLKYNDSDKLNIRYASKSCIGFCFNREIAKVDIYLPESYEGTIKIDSDYGNINIGEFINANIDIKASFGNTEIEKVDRLKINSDAGNVEIGEVNYVTGKLDFGKIDIDKVNALIDLKNNCGDIEIDELLITENSKIEADMGNIHINKTSDIFIDASVDLGSQSIKNNNSRSDITLNVKIDCGNISIDN